METEVGKFRSYTILYNSRDRLFHLRDADGQDVGSGKTQEEAEEQAKKLIKLAFKFPVEALKVINLYVSRGKVTSLNPADPSIRFVFAKDQAAPYGTVMKVYLKWSQGIYEATEANKEIADQIDIARGHIKEMEGRIKNLIERLERPMDMEYFKLKEAEI